MVFFNVFFFFFSKGPGNSTEVLQLRSLNSLGTKSGGLRANENHVVFRRFPMD